MIPQAYIQAWRKHAPWPNPAQVEQDLIICRALCDLFNAPALAGKIAFRFAPESAPQSALKLKVEINTREHEVVFGYRRYPFEVASDWYSARTEIVSFEPEELFGTKLRALLQRRKNRDLFDLHHAPTQLGLDRAKVVACLNHDLALEDHPISRAEAEERMLKKLTRSLTEDIEPLLPVGVRFDETVAIEAFNCVWRQLIARMRGDAWRLSAEVIEQLRRKHTALLP